MRKLNETASQTAGPYVHIGLTPAAAGLQIFERELGGEIAGPEVEGHRIRVDGMIFDGQGDLIKDALIEVWQANPEGRHVTLPNMQGFRGWGRAISDFDTGAWGFDSVKPGSVAGPAGQVMAPHLSFWIVARGINTGLHTRMYFPEDRTLHGTDPVLACVPEDRRATLMAASSQPGRYTFNIRLQGPEETVFFDV